MCHLLCLPHGWVAECADFLDNTIHRDMLLLVPKSYSWSLISHPAYPGSPGRCGSEQPRLKSHPKLCSYQYSLSGKLCYYQDCMSSMPEAKTVNLAIFIFINYLIKMCLHSREAKSWKQNTTILSYGGMDRSESTFPRLTRFFCFVPRYEPGFVWICMISFWSR